MQYALLGVYMALFGAVLLAVAAYFRRHPGTMRRVLPFVWGVARRGDESGTGGSVPGPSLRDYGIRKAEDGADERFGTNLLLVLGGVFAAAGVLLLGRALL